MLSVLCMIGTSYTALKWVKDWENSRVCDLIGFGVEMFIVINNELSFSPLIFCLILSMRLNVNEAQYRGQIMFPLLIGHSCNNF